MRRLTILLAAVGALMLVPAAQAFAETLTLELNGNGAGEVNSAEGLNAIEPNPEIYKGVPPLACSYASPGPQTGTCTTEMEEQEEEGFGPGIAAVTMAAVPSPGSEFAGWTVENGNKFFLGSCQTFEGEAENKEQAEKNWEKCFVFTFTGSGENPKVTATFCEEGTAAEGGAACEEGPAGPELTVVKEGTGSGTVASNPAGIECGGTCKASFETNQKVTLTASPSAGSTFVSWKGCEKGGVNGRQCTVTMDAAKTVNAKFLMAYDVTVNRV
ncbi:MAG TPA: hypothetical protein VFW48_05140, partial [Solirubrobacterales bacterium]|nr:hypothetical protein [Solirubrobacterales bacterium]